MAGRLRIRHKLMLGLVVVVAVMAPLLAGTVLNLTSYLATMKTVDSKLEELAAAHDLKMVLEQVPTPTREGSAEPVPSGLEEERAQLLARAHAFRDKLEVYKAKLQATLERNRDPDEGTREKGIVRFLEKTLGDLQRGVLQSPPTYAGSSPEEPSIRRLPAVSKALADLTRETGFLIEAIYGDLYDRITTSKTHNRRIVWVAASMAVAGFVLLASLLRFFYGWVFSPVRDLQEGARRVARGDFEHKIQVHSSDEMEELAVAFNDMTAHLRDLYQDLERQVNERSRQLIRSERLASVGFLAAGVAHEINNPLASIAFCSEALLARLHNGELRPAADQQAGPLLEKYLKMIQEEAFRCKEITERLLQFSRTSDRKREPTDLGKLIESVLDVTKHLQNFKGKAIHALGPNGQPLDPSSARVVAHVNAQEIKSVVLNLVVNALDSMDEGGTLTIRLGSKAGKAELAFSDTGCGMSEEVLENIFEPFFTQSRTGKGTGLGLTISHRIVTQHGGEIEAHSAGPDQGSTFTVRLPLQPADAEVESRQPRRQAA